MSEERKPSTAQAQEATPAQEAQGVIQVEVGTLDGPITAAHLDRAAIDVQVATAKQYPRSVDRSLKDAITLACDSEEVAESMWYVIPRGGKDITGPSARLAEVMAYSWGNFRVEADVVELGKKYVTAMGIAYDLERNHAVRVRVKRPITDKRGQRYSDDMVGVTANAAMSIALRNAVFKVIPSSYVNRVLEEARRTVAGEGKSLKAKRSAVVSWFGEKGVKPAQVYQLLGVEGLDDLGVKHILRLRGIANAIEAGEIQVDHIFGSGGQGEASASLDAALS